MNNFSYLCGFFDKDPACAFQHSFNAFSIYNIILKEINLRIEEKPKIVTILNDLSFEQEREITKVLKTHVLAFT